MQLSSSYRAVLKVRGVQPFLSMQFWNAFNDNVYKLVVSLLAVAAVGEQASGRYISEAGLVFVLPFFLFSAYAGQLADKFEKRCVVLITKAIEIAAMLLACLALVSGNLNWMLAVLFFTATQAAFFSPAKYGIVPELVEERHLARANGLLEMSTFVAIILGTVAGTYLVAVWAHRPLRIGVVLVAVAVFGTLAGWRIPRTPAPAVQRPFSWNPFGDVAAGWRRLQGDRTLMLTVMGTTYFWFLGALFQMIVILFAKETLRLGDAQTGFPIASLAIGIGVGSMAAGRLSGEKVELGLVPVGAVGMAFAAGLLACTHSLLPALLALAATGFMGGLFIVPLNAILQHRPAADEKGRLLATANVVNTIGIMLASGVVWVLHDTLRSSPAAIIAISAVLTLGVAIYALQLVPHFTARFLLYVLTHAIYRVRVSGKDHVPVRGAALLVANHVSYVDGFLIGSCLHRMIRFLVDETWYDRFAPVFRLFHAIRVPTGNRRSVLKAIELARQELSAGHLVCIFAEGALTLNGDIGEFHRGLEKIIDGMAEVPVIPVHLGGVWGSIFSLDRRASLWRSLRKLPFPISVSFGAPLQQPSASEARQAVAELAVTAAGEAVSSRDTPAQRLARP